MRELDFHDTFLAAEYSHPGDNIAPLVAVAQQLRVRGADLIHGIATAYEIQVDLARGICLHKHKIDHVGIWARRWPPGSAPCCGWAPKLSTTRSRCALRPPSVLWSSRRCAGVDLGVRTLATVATIDTAIGVETITEYPNPTPLKATLTARRWAGRELSRRIPDRAVTGQRKPSRPDSTADACICGGKPPTSSPPSGPAPTATSSLNTSMWPP